MFCPLLVSIGFVLTVGVPFGEKKRVLGKCLETN